MAELTTEDTIYVTYIAAEPAQLWRALTEPEFTRQYFFGHAVESDWRGGAPWLLRQPDGRVGVRGEIILAEPPRLLRLSWRLDQQPALPDAIVTYLIEQLAPRLVRLTMTEAHPTPIPPALLEGGRQGWPMILCGLKSLLETGAALPFPAPSIEQPHAQQA